MRESLAGLAHEVVVDDILYDAMVDAGIAVLPSEGSELVSFVERLLLPAVERSLGGNACNVLRQRLAPALRMADVRAAGPGDSRPGARATFRPRKSLSVIPGAPLEHPVVILTMDDRLIATVRDSLARLSTLTTFSSAYDLAKEERMRPSLLVPAILVDCRQGALGGTLEPLPSLEGAPVVLWSARPFHRGQLEKALPGTRLAGECAPGVPLAEAALLLRHALGLAPR